MKRLTAFLALLAAFALSPASTALAGDVVLATSNTSAAATLTAKEAKRLLTGQTTKWPDGTPVVVVLPPEGSAEITWMCAEILKMPEEVYRRALLQKVFHGAIPKPVSTSTEDAATTIQSTSGAVGPVAADAAGDLVTLQIGG